MKEKAMTKRQRAKVVELLRCAADRQSIGYAAAALDEWHTPPHNDAIRAWEDTVSSLYMPLTGTTYSDVCLEAAQRVEEGTWP